MRRNIDRLSYIEREEIGWSVWRIYAYVYGVEERKRERKIPKDVRRLWSIG